MRHHHVHTCRHTIIIYVYIILYTYNYYVMCIILYTYNYYIIYIYIISYTYNIYIYINREVCMRVRMDESERRMEY